MRFFLSCYWKLRPYSCSSSKTLIRRIVIKFVKKKFLWILCFINWIPLNNPWMSITLNNPWMNIPLNNPWISIPLNNPWMNIPLNNPWMSIPLNNPWMSIPLKNPWMTAGRWEELEDENWRRGSSADSRVDRQILDPGTAGYTQVSREGGGYIFRSIQNLQI